jgi:hypothetical protein
MAQRLSNKDYFGGIEVFESNRGCWIIMMSKSDSSRVLDKKLAPFRQWWPVDP